MKTRPKYRPSTVDERLIQQKAQRYESLMIETIVKGKSSRPRASRMLNIEGVGEFWSGSGRFEAAIHTEEGPKVLEGKVAAERESPDIQSGSTVQWQSALNAADAADAAIRLAYDKLLPPEALKTISTIWERLDRTSELAAARSHILMGKLEKPTLADLPQWFQEQEAGLFECEEGVLPAHPYAVESARLLVRACLATIGDTQRPEAKVETGPMGRLILDWYVPDSRLQWMVDAIDLPWPSVKVYELSRRSDLQIPNPPQTRIFHNAYDAVESFTEFVQGK